jgi:hypothetical protein
MDGSKVRRDPIAFLFLEGGRKSDNHQSIVRRQASKCSPKFSSVFTHPLPSIHRALGWVNSCTACQYSPDRFSPIPPTKQPTTHQDWLEMGPERVTFLPDYLILSHYLTAYHWDCLSFFLSPIPSTVCTSYYQMTCLSGLVTFYLVQ